MNWKDTVNESILAYPTLYLKNSWEASEFAVAHHFFIVLGNGLEWAETKDPLKGGYLTSPKSYKRNGEWKRKMDRPYRKKSVISLNPEIFNPKVKKYQVGQVDHEYSLVTGRIEMKRNFRSRCGRSKLLTEEELTILNGFKVLVLNGDKVYLTSYKKDKHKDYEYVAEEITKWDSLNGGDVAPYPNFQKTYSCFWEIEPELIKPDWKEAGLRHLKYWQEWFNNKDNHKKYSYCPENPINQREDKLVDTLKKWHSEWFKLPSDEFVKKIQKEYNCPIFTGDNWDEMEEYNWQKHLDGIKSFLTETIDRLS